MSRPSVVLGGLALVALVSSVPQTPRAETPAEPQDQPKVPPSPVYQKPYLKRFGRGAMVGGYMDHEFRMTRSDGASFDQRRFIPFVTSAVADYLHVSAEIEFEHGGAVAGDEETDGEIKLEYAVTDFTLDEALTARGGVILSPLGRFNLYHDSPLNDLTERPLVDRHIVPTTLSEAGFGFYGTMYPNELWTVSYEVYAVNGFNEGVLVEQADSASIDLRIREGRGSQREDNNNQRSVVGRLAVSPALGADFGVSLHTGAYDDAGKENLTIVTADALLRRGPVELSGEAAVASAEVPDAARGLAATATRRDGRPREVAEKQLGYYAQASAHFLAGAWKRFPESVWTAVLRYDLVDFDADLTGDDMREVTAGVNFRPVEDAAFKWDVSWQWRRGESIEDWGDSQRTGFFSLATYF